MYRRVNCLWFGLMAISAIALAVMCNELNHLNRQLHRIDMEQTDQQDGSKPLTVHKKSFSSIGCLGNFNKAKFARLDRICDECYQIYRDPEIHKTCR